jgi:hypothetical protein
LKNINSYKAFQGDGLGPGIGDGRIQSLNSLNMFGTSSTNPNLKATKDILGGQNYANGVNIG